jgi:diguanylate cyclase (GGDEF)-like protein/PAS domain S-box-containing protein
LVKERWFARLRGEKVDQIVEFKITTKSGKMRWLSVSDGIIELEGKPVGIGTAFDVTERKKAEEDLQESEEKHRELFEEAMDAIFIADAKTGTLIDCNRAASELVGREKSELIGKNQKILHPSWKIEGEFSNTFKQHLKEKEGQVLSTQIITKDGEIKKVEIKANLIELRGKTVLQGIFRDVTERKRVEEALKESENTYRNLADNALVGIYKTSMKGDILYVNEAMLKMLEFGSPGEMMSVSTLTTYKNPDDRNVLIEKLKKTGRISNFETELLTKTGKSKYVILNATLEDDVISGMMMDITERKQVEEALRESEERYRTIFEDSREAIYVTTKDGKFIEVNEATLDLFGYTREEMLKLKAQKLYVNPDTRKKFQKEIEQTGSVRNYELRFRKKDGIEIDCLLTSTVRKAIDGTIVGYQGIIRDITEIKKIEDQLRHLSLHDPLTGLYNRAYFEEEMHRIESSRYDSVGIIMCDVDGLKLVNDALGHYNGDKLLLATANVLRESFREGDVIARVGGDEFAVLLPASDINAIEIASNRIQDAVARYNSSNLTLPLSISMGFALSTGKPIIMSNLFKEADNNMYREKLHHSLTARSTIVQNLMKALETRDFVTEGHINRMQKLVVALAKAIGLPENSATDLCHLAEFHDIGKVGIPDHILFKQGDLTPDEVIEMQRHCEIGHRIAMCTPDLVPIADLILKHHEWWNGKGYPLGLKEEQIPLECRILAICETYEAMTSDRPYHKAISRDDAIAEVKRCSGTKFDPDLVSRFIQVLERP